MADKHQTEVLQQLEFYFNDYNIRRDDFMKTQLAKNDNVLSFETLMKFKKLANLAGTKEKIKEVVPYSTDLLTLSEDGNGVKRRVPIASLEDNVEERESRTLYVKGFARTNENDDALRARIINYFAKKYEELCKSKPASFKEEIETGHIPTVSITIPVARVDFVPKFSFPKKFVYKNRFFVEFISAEAAQAFYSDQLENTYEDGSNKLEVKTMEEKKAADEAKHLVNKKTHMTLETVGKFVLYANKPVVELEFKLGKSLYKYHRFHAKELVFLIKPSPTFDATDQEKAQPIGVLYGYINKTDHASFKTQQMKMKETKVENGTNPDNNFPAWTKIEIKNEELSSEELDSILPEFKIPQVMLCGWFEQYGKNAANSNRERSKWPKRKFGDRNSNATKKPKEVEEAESSNKTEEKDGAEEKVVTGDFTA